ncbi:hypothetical protein GUJ93_ZPchr0009g2310 [Zizania palustris]|uniref:Uncharacterized protein n=1 Tax=Zizania palustris TaxID=103762 RepID=A0A8J5RMC4_ZIZPA|nr:hypothetical protein GUJ93_ZPchr0009g2310 [Zizania palustris]
MSAWFDQPMAEPGWPRHAMRPRTTVATPCVPATPRASAGAPRLRHLVHPLRRPPSSRLRPSTCANRCLTRCGPRHALQPTCPGLAASSARSAAHRRLISRPSMCANHRSLLPHLPPIHAQPPTAASLSRSSSPRPLCPARVFPCWRLDSQPQFNARGRLTQGRAQEAR